MWSHRRTPLEQETGWLARPDLGFPDLAQRASVADSAVFSECISAIQPIPSIDSDRAAGNTLGIGGTPAVLVNETLLAGLPDSTYLIEHIEKALRR
jgi:protein-disulfide isomerase